MLAVFFGNDTIAVRQKAHEYLERHVPKHVPDRTSVALIDVDSYAKGMVAEAAGGMSLFGGATAYLLDMPSADAAFKEEVEEQLEALQAAPHTFVVIEGPLLAAEKKRYAAHAGHIEEHKRASDRGFNMFAFGDALCRKDKKTLFVLLHDAHRAGISDEEIAGTLWWQLKTLRLAAATDSADEAGMKDYPYQKAKRALSKFKDGELESISESLLAAYHEARQGALPLDLALERWMLSL